MEIPTEITEYTFLVSIPSDVIVEDFESFSVSISGITNPSLVRMDIPVQRSAVSVTTVVTIIDDDIGKIL